MPLYPNTLFEVKSPIMSLFSPSYARGIRSMLYEKALSFATGSRNPCSQGFDLSVSNTLDLDIV